MNRIKQSLVLLVVAAFFAGVNVVAKDGPSKRAHTPKSHHKPHPKPGPATKANPQSLATPQFQVAIPPLDLNTNGTKNITDPGDYYLTDDIDFHPINNAASNVMFHIKSDNVTLDFNAKRVSQGMPNQTLDMVVVKVDPNLHNVVIRNGFITRTSGQGIVVEKGCTHVVINDMIIRDCSKEGMLINGDASDPVVNVTIKDCTSTLNTGDPTSFGDMANMYSAIGAKIVHAQNVHVESCSFNANNNTSLTGNTNTTYGLWMNSCSTGNVVDTQTHRNIANHTTHGCLLELCSTIEVHNGNFNENVGQQGSVYGCAVWGGCDNRLVSSEAQFNQSFDVAVGFDLQGVDITVGQSTVYSGANNNSVLDCESIHNLAQDGDAYGFRSLGCSSNAFVNCLAQANTSGSQQSAKAVGFFAAPLTTGSGTQSEVSTHIDNCYAKMQSSESGTAAGIMLGDKVDLAQLFGNWVSHNSGGTDGFGIVDRSMPSTSLIMSNLAFANATNYSVQYLTSNKKLPISTASIGDFRALSVAPDYNNFEWREEA